MKSSGVDPGSLRYLLLEDGAQEPAAVLAELLAFLDGARQTLDIAIYDLNLPPTLQAELAATLRRAIAGGVRVRLVFNGPRPPRPGYPPPPRTDPEAVEELGVPNRSIPGVPDLMHHKYVVRDGAEVWTGSTNWTGDSWSREENLVLVIPSVEVAASYTRDFEELWTDGRVETTGHFEPGWATTAYSGRSVPCRPLFSPGRGREMSHLVARRIGQARRRLRICSPVLTSGPVLASLAEVRQGLDCRIVYDRTQMAEVLRQWAADPHAAWKAPAFVEVRSQLRCASKVTTPYSPGSVHDFMHAKLVVADDVVVTGSYNLSHSGEMNAENVLEIRDPGLADELAAFVDALFARYG